MAKSNSCATLGALLLLSACAANANPTTNTPTKHQVWPSLDDPIETVNQIGVNDSAVIVAIENYEHQLRIPGAVAVGAVWQDYFEASLGVPPPHVHFLPDGRARREEILRKLKIASDQAMYGGRVWFIFIGHGTTDADKGGLLLGVDTPSNDLRGNVDRGVSHREVIDILERSEGRPIILLDACYSGILPSGEPLNPGIMPPTPAPIPPPDRAIVLSGAANNQYAGDLPTLDGPAFSYLALGALRGWGDLDGNGVIGPHEVAEFANMVMGTVLTRDQTAQAYGDHLAEIVPSGGTPSLNISEIKRLLLAESGITIRGPAASPDKQSRLDKTQEETDQPSAPKPKRDQRFISAGGTMLAFSVGGIGVAIGGAVTIGAAKHDLDTAYYELQTEQANDLRRTGQIMVTTGVIAAGLFLAGGITCVILAEKPRPKLTLAPLFSPNTTGLSIRLQF